MKLRKRIQLKYDGLSPQLKQAAKYVSENTEQVATRSLRQVAEAAGFSPPTLSRLARALDFDSYEELRDLGRQDLSNRKLSFGDKAAALQNYQRGGKFPEKGSFVVAQAASAIDNIQQLLDGVSPEQMVSVAELLAKANHVYLTGFQSSRPIANYLEYIATMAFPNWRMLELEHGSVSKTLYDLGKKDVVVCLMMSPFTCRTVELVKAAAQSKARIISITDSVHSPVCNYADHTFITPTDSPHFFASYVAPLVLLESLIAMVVRRGGKTVQKRIAAVEQLNYEIGDYWQLE